MLGVGAQPILLRAAAGVRTAIWIGAPSNDRSTAAGYAQRARGVCTGGMNLPLALSGTRFWPASPAVLRLRRQDRPPLTQDLSRLRPWAGTGRGPGKSDLAQLNLAWRAGGRCLAPQVKAEQMIADLLIIDGEGVPP